MAIFDAELDLGIEFTFTNVSGKPQVANQYGMPSLEDGQSFSIFESKLKPFHIGIVESGDFTVTPALPPDLAVRADSGVWGDSEHRKQIDRLKSKNSQIEFSDDAPTTASVNDEVTIELFVEDSDGIVNQLDSEVEVDITADRGKIISASGYQSGDLDGVGPIRAKMASGKITLVVTHDTAEAQVFTLSNPTPTDPALTVSDTHTVTYS